MEKGNEIKTVVPALRFPEFIGMNGWEEKKLEEIGNFIGGGTPNTAIKEYWDGGIPWYTPTEIKNGYLKSSNRTITEKGLKNSSAKLLPQGAILITTRATIGDVAISKEECTTNQGFQSLVVNNSESNLFWFYWIIGHKEDLIKRASGSTFKEISKNEIKNITSYSPKKQEQQKIADCLFSLDELIEATTQKVETLKKHKKGLMQQLFPVEGNNVPDLRFPEFQVMEGWEKTYIYEECPNPYSGGTPKTSKKKYYGGNIPFIRSAEIGKDKTELSITQEGLNNSSAKMIQKGDLLIALYGANSGDIAISKIDGAINQAILCLKAKSNNLFIYYTLLKKQKYIVSKYLQGGQGNLSGEIIKSIDFYIPQKIEQQKIANCLSSLDELIEATSRKVEILKEHKKGLMQQLFPKI